MKPDKRQMNTGGEILARMRKCCTLSEKEKNKNSENCSNFFFLLHLSWKVSARFLSSQSPLEFLEHSTPSPHRTSAIIQLKGYLCFWLPQAKIRWPLPEEELSAPCGLHAHAPLRSPLSSLRSATDSSQGCRRRASAARMGTHCSSLDDILEEDMHHWYTKFMRESPSGLITLFELKTMLEMNGMTEEASSYVDQVFFTFDMDGVRNFPPDDFHKKKGKKHFFYCLF